MTNKIKNGWDNLDKSVQKWATRIGAITTILGALVAGGSWLIHQVDNAVATRIENQTEDLQQEVKALSDKVDERDKQFDLQLTRLELMNLIELDPHNVVEIEKVAKHYFSDLRGDWYLTSVYSKWAKQYGGDMTYVIE